MEQLGNELTDVLLAGKIADQLYTGEALPQYQANGNAHVLKQLYIRYTSAHPDDGLYCLIRYLADKNCPGCHPIFVFTDHQKGCLMPDHEAIDAFFDDAMEILGVPGSEDLKTELKARHRIASLMKRWKKIEAEDPLVQSKLLANTLLDVPSLANLLKFVFYRNDVVVPDDEIEHAVEEAEKLINTK